MKSLYKKPLDQSITDWWLNIDPSYRISALFIIGINVLAFGFEMANLTLHHDDVAQIFIQSDILGHYLGRFGLGRLHYFGQSAYFMPFLQMVEGILFMTAYGLIVARFWGIKKAADVIFVASILCVFPFMGQLYQYNTAMATYSMAHFLAALAVILSTRATMRHVTASALLYTAAFSIYQGVVANAATIFCVWMLSKLLLDERGEQFYSKSTVKAIGGAVLSVGVGGALYAAIVIGFIDLSGDSIHSAETAFSLGDKPDILYTIQKVLGGTRAFFFWPENYFPGYLKNVQLVFLALAATACVWLPKNLLDKGVAVVILCMTILMPRILQIIHPEGNYHNLAFTAYAVVIAGFVMLVNRAGPVVVRNLSSLLVVFLIAGYILQCNWISTVNYLNTLAHVTTLTQVLARVRSLPDKQWDGTTIAVAGMSNMNSEHPFRRATGVATSFMEAAHMQALARLMRDDATFINVDETTPKALEYAATHDPWPHPSSVGIVDGIGVVVLSESKERKD